MFMEDDNPIGVNGMLRYLYARKRVTITEETTTELVALLHAADKYCLRALSEIVVLTLLYICKDAIFERSSDPRSIADVKALVESAFAEEAASVWEKLRSIVAGWFWVIILKEKAQEAMLVTVMEKYPELKKEVWRMSIESLRRAEGYPV